MSATLLNLPAPTTKKELFARLRQIIDQDWQEMPTGVARFDRQAPLDLYSSPSYCCSHRARVESEHVAVPSEAQ